jgi:dinuclear metal center YbgI/SA1388 family protein
MGFLFVGWGGGMGWKGGHGEGVSFVGGVGYKVGMRAQELARECDHILTTKSFRDYPGARNGLQVSHERKVKKVGWAVDADLESIRKAGKEKVDFLIVHHGIFWGSSALDRKIRAKRIREAKRLGVAIYSSHLPLDAHPELGNSIGLLRALGLEKWKRKSFGEAMGREIGYKVEGGRVRLGELANRVALLRSNHTERVGSFAGLECRTLLRCEPRQSRGSSFEGLQGQVKVVGSGPKICRKIGIVTGGFGDLDQVVKAGLDTLITGEADYPTEVKARELGLNLILGGHRETEVFGVRKLAHCLRNIKDECSSDN